jgi:hypothetical protein
MNFHRSYIKNLELLKKYNPMITKLIMVYTGTIERKVNEVDLINWRSLRDRSGVRGPGSEVRSPKSGVRGPKSVVRGPGSEVRGRWSVVVGRWSVAMLFWGFALLRVVFLQAFLQVRLL